MRPRLGGAGGVTPLARGLSEPRPGSRQIGKGGGGGGTGVLHTEVAGVVGVVEQGERKPWRSRVRESHSSLMECRGLCELGKWLWRAEEWEVVEL